MCKFQTKLLILAVCARCIFGVVHHIRPSSRVILGTMVDSFDVPFYCTMFTEFNDDSGTAICGCALIEKQKAITAAHCVIRMNGNRKEYPSAVFIRLYGAMRTLDGEMIRLNVQKIRVAPTYRPYDLYHDIAVLEIPGAEKVKGVTGVVINTHRETWNGLNSWNMLKVVGVGLDRNDALSLGTPRVAHLSKRSCSNPVGYGDLLPWFLDTYHDDICAGPFTPCDADYRCADSCKGDSGGPLYSTANNGSVVVYGVVSRGSDSCGVTGQFDGRPGIYAPTDLHMVFIQEPYMRHADKQSSASYTSHSLIFFNTFLCTLFLLS